MLQVKYIVGYNIPHADRMQDIVYNLIVRADRFRWMEAAMGLTWIVLLLAIRNAPRFHKCDPSPICSSIFLSKREHRASTSAPLLSYNLLCFLV